MSGVNLMQPAMPDFAVSPEEYEHNVEKMVVSAKKNARVFFF